MGSRAARIQTGTLIMGCWHPKWHLNGQAQCLPEGDLYIILSAFKKIANTCIFYNDRKHIREHVSSHSFYSGKNSIIPFIVIEHSFSQFSHAYSIANQIRKCLAPKVATKVLSLILTASATFILSQWCLLRDKSLLPLTCMGMSSLPQIPS